jgi:hypothetical protein
MASGLADGLSRGFPEQRQPEPGVLPLVAGPKTSSRFEEPVAVCVTR